MATEWTMAARDAMEDTTGRILFVDDGYVGHFRPLLEGEGVREALADYAAGYDCDPQTIVASWYLFVDGREVDDGTYRFEVGELAGE